MTLMILIDRLKCYQDLVYTCVLWLQGFAGRESLGTKFLVASVPTKQMSPFFGLKYCKRFFAILKARTL
jgi:hypothetical protein